MWTLSISFFTGNGSCCWWGGRQLIVWQSRSRQSHRSWGHHHTSNSNQPTIYRYRRALDTCVKYNAPFQIEYKLQYWTRGQGNGLLNQMIISYSTRVVSFSDGLMWYSWWWPLMLTNRSLHRLQTDPPCLLWLYLWIKSLANWLKDFLHWTQRKIVLLCCKLSWQSLRCLSNFLMDEDWMSQMSHLSTLLALSTSS